MGCVHIPVHPDGESGFIRTLFREHPDSDSGVQRNLVGALLLGWWRYYLLFYLTLRTYTDNHQAACLPGLPSFSLFGLKQWG
jgi:hypothetical protein